MSILPKSDGDKFLLDKDGIGKLIHTLVAKGYRVIGPVERDYAIIYDDISQLSDLPAGAGDLQAKAQYRLIHREDQKLFGYNLGPESWKKYLHPAVKTLFRAVRERNSFRIERESENDARMALIGVRSCDLHAIELLDKILAQGGFPDPSYSARRKNMLIVAVNCSQAGQTCFCHSMKTGPRASSGYDIALTEIATRGKICYLAEAGSLGGLGLLSALPSEKANDNAIGAAEAATATAISQMGRSLETAGLKEALYRNHDNLEWDAAAARCLTCGNCTMVCPTCFCTTIEDTTDLLGKHAERCQKWDSCFTADFSYIHGGSIRQSSRARYRQMVTHKLASWVDQFGAFGCVGCGRCITWCPAAIDITEEARAVCTGERSDIPGITLKES